MAFVKQNIINRSLEFPSRYTLYNTETSAVLGTFDLVQITGTVFAAGTKVNKELLQRYEDALNDLNITISATQPTSGWWFELI